MQQFLQIGFYVAMAAVLIILVVGIINLARTDEGQASRSNQLMRLRVIMQFVAVMFVVAIGWFAGAFN